MSYKEEIQEKQKVERIIRENAETLKELKKGDSKSNEEFNKLKKSDDSLEDLKK